MHVTFVNYTIAVPAVFCLVEFCQSQKAVGVGRCRLLGEIAEQLLSVADVRFSQV
jgi:hypothetical protein